MAGGQLPECAKIFLPRQLRRHWGNFYSRAANRERLRAFDG